MRPFDLLSSKIVGPRSALRASERFAVTVSKTRFASAFVGSCASAAAHTTLPARVRARQVKSGNTT